MGNGYAGWVGNSDSNHPANAHHFAQRQHQSKMRTNTPVKVMSDPFQKNGTWYIHVQPMINQVDGSGQSVPHGTVYNIPVHSAQGTNGSHYIAPAKGDIGWLAIGDRDHSSILATGGQSNPGSRRMHSFEDGYYKGGMAGINTPNSSIVQDQNGITHTTKKDHTFNASQGGHVINSKSTTINSPTNGVSVFGNVNGNGYAQSNFSGYGTTSDARAKTVEGATPGIEFIRSLRPVAFRWRERPSEGVQWGLIAQEVKASCEAAGVEFAGWRLEDDSDPDSRQSLQYDQLIAPLIKAVQQMAARLEILERKALHESN